MSGHALWAAGFRGMETEFIIVNSAGNIELKFQFPWGSVSDTDNYYFFNYGLGPWGEFYCLLPPPHQEGKKYFTPQPGNAELVVVRNHLKYFGRTNDSGVRLRKGPTTKDEVIDTLPVKTGFRILERNGKQETINGKTSDWVKVRLLDGREGWMFGAFVANLYDGPGTPPPWPNVPDW